MPYMYVYIYINICICIHNDLYRHVHVLVHSICTCIRYITVCNIDNVILAHFLYVYVNL